jgi:hypothetical protein
MRMTKHAPSWDEAHIQMVEEAEGFLGRDVCGAKIPKPKIDEYEHIENFKKRFEEWEKLPFCTEQPVSENGRCERHGGLSTGAGTRVPKEEEIDEEIEGLPTEDEDQERFSLIPLPQDIEITPLELTENPYIIGSKVLDDLGRKGYSIPYLIEPLIQQCESCYIREECPYGRSATGKCQYERRRIHETFGVYFSKNPNADPHLVYDLAMSIAELFRTEIIMSVIGVIDASKKKVTQERNALRKHIATLIKQLDDEVKGLKQTPSTRETTQSLLGELFSGRSLDKSTITLIERKMEIKKEEDEEEDVIEVESEVND